MSSELNVYSVETSKKIDAMADRIIKAFENEDIDLVAYACGRIANRRREERALERTIKKAEEELNSKRKKFRKLRANRREMKGK